MWDVDCISTNQLLPRIGVDLPLMVYPPVPSGHARSCVMPGRSQISSVDPIEDGNANRATWHPDCQTAVDGLP